VPSESVEPLRKPVPRLERDLDGRLLSDWPGRRGPLVCLNDPLGSLPGLPSALGRALAPDWRVIQPTFRPEAPYQAHAAQTLWLLDTFGFEQPVLLGSGLGGGIALLIAAWYPKRVAGLVLVSPGLSRARRLKVEALAAEQPAWRGWLDAPPAWRQLERRVVCPRLRLGVRSARRVVDATREFLYSAVQSPACC
jgi:pimeloyl-ACP methyl ester carboxylesterase